MRRSEGVCIRQTAGVGSVITAALSSDLRCGSAGDLNRSEQLSGFSLGEGGGGVWTWQLYLQPANQQIYS